MRHVTIAVDPPYDVVVGPGVLAQLGAHVGERRTVAIVTNRVVGDLYGATVRDALATTGATVLHYEIDDGEAAKSLATVERLCRGFAAGGLARRDAVVALGGGVVGDTAGFAAAVYHRGVAVVQCPTTLLGMVDAAIGGKTAVNLPEGKNLVGAFHQPCAVLADVTTLTTLPEREYRSGLGEVAKYALVHGASDPAGVRALCAEKADAIAARDQAVLEDLVARCAAIKGDVVARDPSERTGLRAILNYGHTLAHALETIADYKLAHGEAVAIGLVFTTALGEALERASPGATDDARSLLTMFGLPTRVPGDVDPAELMTVMRRDKKASGGLTFVLPGIDGPTIVEDPPMPAVRAALRAVGLEG